MSTERTEAAPTATPTSRRTPRRTPTMVRTAPAGTGVELKGRLNCEPTVVGSSRNCRTALSNGGRPTIRVASVQLEGEAAGEFRVLEDCVGTLTTNTAGTLVVEFLPTAAGVHEAVLAVHLDPADTRRVTVRGEAMNEEPGPTSPTCDSGRTASPGVTPAEASCATPS